MRMIICDLCQAQAEWRGGGKSLSVGVADGRAWHFDLCLRCEVVLQDLKREDIREVFQRLIVHPGHRMAAEDR